MLDFKKTSSAIRNRYLSCGNKDEVINENVSNIIQYNKENQENESFNFNKSINDKLEQSNFKNKLEKRKSNSFSNKIINNLSSNKNYINKSIDSHENQSSSKYNNVFKQSIESNS
jgi:hypothetical protein